MLFNIFIHKFHYLIIVVIAIIVLLHNVSSRSLPNNNKCLIKLPNDIPATEPIYLIQKHRKLGLFDPYDQINYIINNKTILLYCPGRRNHIKFKSFNENFLTLQCRENSFKLFNENSVVQLKDLTCNKNPFDELIFTNQRCANNQGYLYEIGFKLNEIRDNKDDFFTIFKICYNNQTENTFYAWNVINGKAIKYSVKENKRKEFKSTGMASGSNEKVRKIYNRQNQERRFIELFGSSQQYINQTMFLARGHLTPDGDFIFPSAQLATYYYANVAPQFQSINTGNWKRVENLARKLASDFKVDFEIYTGFHETLKLRNNVGQLKEIYLDDSGKFEVPLYFWKVIKNLESNAAIAIVTLNNPFINQPNKYQFCTNVCNRASLQSKHFNSAQKGFTFCCEINDFKKTIHDLPENFQARSLLNCASINLD